MITYTVTLGKLTLEFTIPEGTPMTFQNATMRINNEIEVELETEVSVIDLRAFAHKMLLLTRDS
jgi:hypothetical protein